MSTSYLPSREADLGQWTTHFAAQVATLLASIGVTSAQSTNLNTLNTNWTSALSVATAEATRTKSTVAAKNTAKQQVLAAVRQLVGIIQKYPGTTNAMRGQLGITIPSSGPSPRPVPTTAPIVVVESVYQKSIKGHLEDAANPGKRKKPNGVYSGQIYTFVGQNPPTDIGEWVFQGAPTRADFEIQMPDTTPDFSKVWIIAVWANYRNEVGPKSNAVAATLGASDGQKKLAA